MITAILFIDKIKSWDLHPKNYHEFERNANLESALKSYGIDNKFGLYDTATIKKDPAKPLLLDKYVRWIKI